MYSLYLLQLLRLQSRRQLFSGVSPSSLSASFLHVGKHVHDGRFLDADYLVVGHRAFHSFDEAGARVVDFVGLHEEFGLGLLFFPAALVQRDESHADGVPFVCRFAV